MVSSVPPVARVSPARCWSAMTMRKLGRRFVETPAAGSALLAARLRKVRRFMLLC
jgi:hypothetical protein